MNIDENDEREFLHSLASPIGTAFFLADSLLDNMQNCHETNPNELMQAVQIFEALETIKKLLIQRRELLIKRGAPNART